MVRICSQQSDLAQQTRPKPCMLLTLDKVQTQAIQILVLHPGSFSLINFDHVTHLLIDNTRSE